MKWLSRVVWAWERCSDCNGLGYTYSDMSGCPSCYGGGRLPYHHWPWNQSALWRKLVRRVPAVRP